MGMLTPKVNCVYGLVILEGTSSATNHPSHSCAAAVFRVTGRVTLCAGPVRDDIWRQCSALTLPRCVISPASHGQPGRHGLYARRREGPPRGRLWTHAPQASRTRASLI